MKTTLRHLLMLVLLTPMSSSVADVLGPSADVWLRERNPDAVFEDDLISVWNSSLRTSSETNGPSRRYGILEFDLSAFSGVDITNASLRLWAGDTGKDALKAIKQSAWAIDTSTGTPTTSMTWNIYHSEFAGTASPFEGLGSYNLTSPTEIDRFFDSSATPADLNLLEQVASGSFAANKKLTLVMIAAEEDPGVEYGHTWGDGSLGGMAAQLLINENPPEVVELSLEINRATGDMWIKNPGVDTRVDTQFDVDGFTIESPAGSLTPDTFEGLTGDGVSGFQLIDLTSTGLTELSLGSARVFEEGDSNYLGKGYAIGAAEDPALAFTYSLESGGTFEGHIVYLDGLIGDFNGDNIVNLADYTVWRDNLGASNATASEGDADGNGTVNEADYQLWKSHFGESLTPEAMVASQSTVPEPSALLLLGALSALLATVTSRHRR
jgi:hypothetical protein